MSGCVESSRCGLEQRDTQRLLAAVKELSYLRDVPGVMEVVKRVARELTQADGVTFVLREGDLVYYAEENAIGPLWKGRRFPARACISGWAIEHKQSVVIENIRTDSRIPLDAYESTFVRSLAMVPIRQEDPLGAIGAYWARPHHATQREVELLTSLAGATAIAMANAELYAQAQAAIALRDDFMAIASHELKTPLTPLLLQAQRLKRVAARGPVDSAVLGQALNCMDAALLRLGRLVDNLLDVSRIKEGRLELENEQVDLTLLVKDVLERFDGELERNGCQVESVLTGSVTGWWDRLRLEQVVVNLLSNAVKFGQRKPIGVCVDTTRQHSNGVPLARLTVQDHGVGILPQDHELLFQRFGRALCSRHHGGFGVGLWIVRQIVDAHGGTIEVQSVPGEGATFRVLLPLATQAR